jgi:prepilin-type N-terminal cleavage/methylation domain-containing protein
MRTRGYTLVELLASLLLLAALLAIGLPPLSRWRNESAVRAARDDLAAALAWTRVAAASGDGATLVLDPDTGRFWTERAGERTPTVDLARRYRVRVETGASVAVRFRYDALGIGRLANRTVRFRRSAALAGLTVNSYGRIHRW